MSDPVITITSGATSPTTAYTLTGTVEDAQPLNFVRYRVNGGPLVDLPAVTGPFSVGVTLREGANTVAVHAEDNLSNAAVVAKAVKAAVRSRFITGEALLRFAPRALRLSPPSQRILRPFFNAAARCLRILQQRRARLIDLMNPAKIEARFLHELAYTVGLSPDVRVTAHVSGEQWRRVIDLAPAIWEQKGAHEPLRDMVRAFARTRMWIGDWFSFRVVAGETLLPWYGVDPMSNDAGLGEYTTEVHVEDLAGTLVRNAAEDALADIRNYGERIHLTFVHFVENWDSLSRWGDQAGTVTLGTQVVALDASAAAAHVGLDTGDQSGWDHVVYNSIVRLGAGSELRLRVRDDGLGDFLDVRIAEGDGPDNIEIFRGVTSRATATHPLPATPQDVLLSIRTAPLNGGDLQIDVVVDGVVDITHAESSPPAPGRVSFRVAAGGAGTVVWFEVLPVGAETRTIP